MAKTGSRLLFVFIVLAFAGSACGQQLVLLKKGKVVYRFNEGDHIYFRFKEERQIIHAVIQSIREFYFVTVGLDTIPYARVSSLNFRNEDKRKFGMVTAFTSLGLLAVYGLNTLAFDENTTAMRGLRFVAFTGIFYGTIVYLRSERDFKLNGKRRLKYVSYDSPLYR